MTPDIIAAGDAEALSGLRVLKFGSMLSRPFALVLRQCTSCDLVFFCKRPMGPACWSTDLIWEQASGNGAIVSFSPAHPSNRSSFDDLPTTTTFPDNPRSIR